MFIPDRNFFHTGSRIQSKKYSGSRIWILRIKEFKYYNQNIFISSQKYDPGCSFRIRILIFYPSRIQGSKRRRIRIRNTVLITYGFDWICPSYPQSKYVCHLSIKSSTCIVAQYQPRIELETLLTSSFMPRRKTPGG
jgi:hypothetical protein